MDTGSRNDYRNITGTEADHGNQIDKSESPHNTSKHYRLAMVLKVFPAMEMPQQVH